MLVQQDVVVDPALSNVSIRYSNESYIADLIYPTIKTAKQTGKYYLYNKDNLRRPNTHRAAGSGANEIDFGLSTSTFICEDHALKEFVADEIQDQADAALNPLVDSTETITDIMLLDREYNLANSITSTSVLTNNVSLAGTDQWSDYSNSDPISDIRTARTSVHQNIFRKANTLILGKPVFDVLIDHPAVVDRIKYSQLGVATEQLLARVFQVDTVLVGEAGQNTAKEGQTDVLAYVWGKNAIVCYVTPSVGLKKITLGYTFTYGVRQVKRWRDEDRQGTYVRIGNDNYVQQLIAAPAGYLIATAVA